MPTPSPEPGTSLNSQLSTLNHQLTCRRVSPTSRGVPLRTGRLRVQILHAAPLLELRIADYRGSAECFGFIGDAAENAESQVSPTGNVECQPDKRTGPVC